MCHATKRFFLCLFFGAALVALILLGLAIQITWLPFAAVMSIIGYMVECVKFPCRREEAVSSWIFEVWFFPLVFYLHFHAIDIFDDRFPIIESLLEEVESDGEDENIISLISAAVLAVLWMPFGIFFACLGGMCAIVCRCPMEYLVQLAWELLFFPLSIGGFNNPALDFVDPFSESDGRATRVDEIPAIEI